MRGSTWDSILTSCCTSTTFNASLIPQQRKIQAQSFPNQHCFSLAFALRTCTHWMYRDRNSNDTIQKTSEILPILTSMRKLLNVKIHFAGQPDKSIQYQHIHESCCMCTMASHTTLLESCHANEKQTWTQPSTRFSDRDF